MFDRANEIGDVIVVQDISSQPRCSVCADGPRNFIIRDDSLIDRINLASID